MVIFVVCAIVLALAAMLVLAQRKSVVQAKNLLKKEQEKLLKLEEKLDVSRNELRKNKEELERGKNALVEARELSKKKLKRQAISIEKNDQEKEKSMSNNANDENQKVVSAMESQVERLKQEHSQLEENLKKDLEVELKKQGEAKGEEIESLKKKISNLQEEIKRQKKLLKPEGNKIDLKEIPEEAAAEFARVYRKAEHHERLHGIARAKLHLAQEKFTDLQKRYFSVCRELAVSMGKTDGIDNIQARDIAEKIVGEKEQDAPVIEANISGDAQNNGSEQK